MTTTKDGPTALPDLPHFTEHYGIRVAYIGDDGDLISLGHHQPRRVIAAFNRHARTVAGLRNITDDMCATYANIADWLTTGWAVQLTDRCGECGDDPDCGTCPAVRATTAEGSWWISWNAKPATPGAFPVTTWRA